MCGGYLIPSSLIDENEPQELQNISLEIFAQQARGLRALSEHNGDGSEDDEDFAPLYPKESHSGEYSHEDDFKHETKMEKWESSYESSYESKVHKEDDQSIHFWGENDEVETITPEADEEVITFGTFQDGGTITSYNSMKLFLTKSFQCVLRLKDWIDSTISQRMHIEENQINKPYIKAEKSMIKCIENICIC
jgi:hypothetical protein